MSYEKNRKKVVEEQLIDYGYNFCQHCGKSNGFHKLHCHHLIFRSEAPKHKDLHNPKNLIIVCNVCHDKFHDKKETRNKYIEERELKILFSDLVEKNQIVL